MTDEEGPGYPRQGAHFQRIGALRSSHGPFFSLRRPYRRHHGALGAPTECSDAPADRFDAVIECSEDATESFGTLAEQSAGAMDRSGAVPDRSITLTTRSSGLVDQSASGVERSMDLW